MSPELLPEKPRAPVVLLCLALMASGIPGYVFLRSLPEQFVAQVQDVSPVAYSASFVLTALLSAWPAALLVLRRRLLAVGVVAVWLSLHTGMLIISPVLIGVPLPLVYIFAPAGLATAMAAGGRRDRARRAYGAGLVGAYAALFILILVPGRRITHVTFANGIFFAAPAFWLIAAAMLGFADDVKERVGLWWKRRPLLPGEKGWAALDLADQWSHRHTLIHHLGSAFLLTIAVVFGWAAIRDILLSLAYYIGGEGLTDGAWTFVRNFLPSVLKVSPLWPGFHPLCIALIAAAAAVPFSRFAFSLALFVVSTWQAAFFFSDEFGPAWAGVWASVRAGGAALIMFWEIARGRSAFRALNREEENEKAGKVPVRLAWEAAFAESASRHAAEAFFTRGPYPEYRQDTRLLFWYWAPPSYVFQLTSFGMVLAFGIFFYFTGVPLLAPVMILQLIVTELLDHVLEAPVHLAKLRASRAVQIAFFRPFRQAGARQAPSIIVPALVRCGRVWTAFSDDFAVRYKPDYSAEMMYSEPVRLEASGHKLDAREWRAAIELLLEISDVVVMDLSTLSPNLLWEFELVRSRYMRPRIIFLYDRNADPADLKHFHELAGSSAAVSFGKSRISRLTLALKLRKAVLRASASEPCIPGAEQLQAAGSNLLASDAERRLLTASVESAGPRCRFGFDIAAWYARRAVLNGSMIALERLGMLRVGDEQTWPGLSVLERLLAVVWRGAAAQASGR